MKRIIAVLSVMAIMAAMMVVLAMPAFAQASENAGCKGQILSTAATQLPPGTVGAILSEAAQELGGIGQVFGEVRSCNPNANPQGGGIAQ